MAAGTGDVLMARLRKGRANTGRGTANFLHETVSRVRYAGATGPLTVRADSGIYTCPIVAACRDKSVRFSITIRQHQSVWNIIEAIPEADWTPIPYWMEGAADVAETEYTPFKSEPDAVPVRLIVRRVRPTPGSQPALFATYSYHAFITDRDGDTLAPEADHRRHAEIENAIRDLKYGVGQAEPASRGRPRQVSTTWSRSRQMRDTWLLEIPSQPRDSIRTCPVLDTGQGYVKGFHGGEWQVMCIWGLGSGQGSGSSQTRRQSRPWYSNRRSQPTPYRITLTVLTGRW